MSKIIVLWHYLNALLNRPELRKNREEFEKWQSRKVESFIKGIIKKSPFYRRYYQGLNTKDWKSFPCIDKETMMDNFDLVNTAGIKKDKALRIALESEKSRDFSRQYGNITVGLSSGTSGNKGIFLASPAERSHWAGGMMARLLPKPIWKKQRVALFLRANSKLYESVSSKTIRFSFFDLFDDIDGHIARLNSEPPDILIAPPSMLRILAEALKKGGLKIKPLKIVSAAEVLDPLDAEYIKAQFGGIIHQVYQCTEGSLAVTCEYGTLHLNESHVCVQKEYLDEKSGRFMPIVTDFSRTTQPIVRYRLDDILTEDQTPCPCGSVHVALKSIEGRMDDLFHFESADKDGYVTVFPDFIRRAVISASGHIQEYVVVQRGFRRLEVALRCDEHLRDRIVADVEKAFKRLAQRMGAVTPEIAFSGDFALKKGVKLRRVIRKFDPAAAKKNAEKMGSEPESSI